MIYIISACFIIGALLLIKMFNIANENHIRYLTLSYSTFPQSAGKLTLFFISDIHNRVVDETIINEVRGKADFVIIGGDLTDSRVPLEKTEENLKRLSQIATVFFIWGNNDYEVNQDKLQQLFKKYQVSVLENQSVKIKGGREDVGINLIGIGELAFERDNLELALKNIKTTDFNIAVCHNPEIMNQITKRHPISLLLSGHTHGGQIRIFGIGPSEKGKLHRHPNLDHLISNGYGTTMFPLRLGARPETHLITIKHK